MKANKTNWDGKAYNSLSSYFKHVYHEKIYKISLDGGFTCPNRDGTLDTRGCIFCSSGGSGDFAVTTKKRSMTQQIQEGISLFGSKKIGNRFIAYFQAYTNTYAPIEYLRTLYVQALDDAQIAGISIATRPDCLDNNVILLLKELKEHYPAKFIWVELGLQTIHEKTAYYIRRSYPLSTCDKAIAWLHSIAIPVILHIIIGLPGESKEMLLETINYVNQKRVFGIKLQLLHVLRDTDLAIDYTKQYFKTLSKEEYFELVTECLLHLSPDIVVHRLTGDGPKQLLLAPLWSTDKRGVLNGLHQYIKQKNAYQGKEYALWHRNQ